MLNEKSSHEHNCNLLHSRYAQSKDIGEYVDIISPHSARIPSLRVGIHWSYFWKSQPLNFICHFLVSRTFWYKHLWKDTEKISASLFISFSLPTLSFPPLV